MILYLDTSALVKLYLEEKDSELVALWVDRVDEVASSVVAYAEACSAFRRAYGEHRITENELMFLLETFDADWKKYTRVGVSQTVLRTAREVILKHGLRGFDGLHLASAISMMDLGDEVVFASFDDKLNKAASLEGFMVIV